MALLMLHGFSGHGQVSAPAEWPDRSMAIERPMAALEVSPGVRLVAGAFDFLTTQLFGSPVVDGGLADRQK